MQNINYKETKLQTIDGWVMLLITMLLIGFLYSINVSFVFMVIIVTLLTINMSGFFILNPNEALVATLFGKYSGTHRIPGLYWTNPFSLKRKISTKIQNLTTPYIKTNDKNMQPIEIAATFIWKLNDTAKALFAVENYEMFLQIQCETGLRQLAENYAYESKEGLNFKNNKEEMSKILKEQIIKLINFAGLDLEEVKITHVSYSPEVAQAILQQQQAIAIIEARKKIADDMIDMAEDIIAEIEERELAELSNEDRIKIITNLMLTFSQEEKIKKSDKEKLIKENIANS